MIITYITDVWILIVAYCYWSLRFNIVGVTRTCENVGSPWLKKTTEIVRRHLIIAMVPGLLQHCQR